jgi:hypothetical protein
MVAPVAINSGPVAQTEAAGDGTIVPRTLHAVPHGCDIKQQVSAQRD